MIVTKINEKTTNSKNMFTTNGMGQLDIGNGVRLLVPFSVNGKP